MKTNSIIECFERNLKIYLAQKESREDRDITVLILGECLDSIEAQKERAVKVKDIKTYFKLSSALSKAERKLERYLDRMWKDTDFMKIYCKIIKLLPRK